MERHRRWKLGSDVAAARVETKNLRFPNDAVTERPLVNFMLEETMNQRANQPPHGPVAELQASGFLLLRHVTRRFDRSLAVGTFPELLAKDIGLLTAKPERFDADPEAFGNLARCVDDLSRRAAPANVNTIRLTCGYLKLGDEDAGVDRTAVQRARGLRHIFNCVFILAMIVTGLAVLLLAHVDSGRRSAQQLREVNSDIRTIFGEFLKLPGTTWALVSDRSQALAPAGTTDADDKLMQFLPFCEAEQRKDAKMAESSKAAATPEAPSPRPPHWVPRASAEGARGQELCGRWTQATLREQIIYLRLQEWNCQSDRWRSGFMHGCADLPDAASGIVTNEHWHRTELRTAAVISGLTGFVLPMALGCIGGCAYVLRRLDRKLAAFTLDENDGMHAILRVLLATMLGGLLGVVWSADQQVEVGGFNLSLAAMAFFVGFALEVVFSTIESLVEGVASKVRSG